jgi:hypothetical protein
VGIDSSIVFGWTHVQFSFRVRSGRKLKIAQPPIITVIGKVFFDIGHAPAQRTEVGRMPHTAFGTCVLIPNRN